MLPLEAGLGRPRLEVRGILVEEIAAARVEADLPVEEVIRELEVHGLVAQVDAVRLRAQEELVAQVRALMIEPREHFEWALRVGAREGGEVVGIDEVVGRGVHVEDREHAGLDADLPVPTERRDGLSVERDGLAEAHGRDVAEVGVVEIALDRGAEVWPARIREERIEDEPRSEEHTSELQSL